MFAFGGVITKQVLFSPRISIPQFLLDTKKPVHVLHRSSQIIDWSSIAGGPLTFQKTMTAYYVEDVKPEQLIECLSTVTGIKDELVMYNHYSFWFEDIDYDISHSPYANQTGTLVEVTEISTSVSNVDLWASNFVPFWTALRFGYVNKTPSQLAGRSKIPSLDLKRIKKARPKTQLS